VRHGVRDDHGIPHLYRVPLDGGAPSPFIREFSVNPVWSSDGRLAVHRGPDIGTRFSVKAVTTEAAVYPLPALTLTRGAGHVTFMAGQRPALVYLRGDIQHKDVWVVDLETGAERRLTNLPHGFDVGDFDVPSEGREAVLERAQEDSDIFLLDRR
jgi:hypothetical protein